MRVRARVPATAAVLWAANWLALRATGHAYSTRVLYAGWQFLPVEAAGDDPIGAVWIVAWNAFAGIVFELGEQERFRSTTDPLVLAAAGWWLLQRAGHLRTPAVEGDDPSENDEPAGIVVTDAGTVER